MDIAGVGKRVRIYIGESDQYRGQALFMKILELLRSEGCAGATVVRGLAGFGANSRIHTATILRLSEDLPVVVEWVDRADRVERILPRVRSMLQGGLITLEDVQIAHYAHRPVSDVGDRLRVREVMTRGVTVVHPETSLREAVALLVNQSYRALPVVDAENRIAGIVTNSDLVERGGLRVRMEMLGALPEEVLKREVDLLEEGRTVADVMHEDVITTSPDSSLSEAAHQMVANGIKRLPVVDESKRLLGMVSRVDLLSSLSEGFSPPPEDEQRPAGPTIGAAMRKGVPTLAPGAALGEVLDAVISTRLNRAIVLDADRRVVGIVSDAELIRRLSPRDRPGVLRVLMGRVPLASQSPEERRRVEQISGTTASDLMLTGVPTVSGDTPVGEGIRLMIANGWKVLPVVDEQGRFVGALDRADLLKMVSEVTGAGEPQDRGASQ